MGKNRIRMPPWGTAALRWISTASEMEWKPLYRRLSALSCAPEGSIAETLDLWVLEGRKVEAFHLMRHVRELRKHRCHKHALEMMDWMEKYGLEMPNGSRAVRLDLLSTVEGIDSAEKYFSSLGQAFQNHAAYGALLSCYCKEKMADKAIALYEKMKQLNLTFNTLTYNNLMSLYIKLGQTENVPRLFQEMKASNVFRDNCTHRILMKSYALMNDINSIDKLVQEMEDIQGALDWSTYCHIAALYNSAGHFEKAMVALKKAELVMDRRDMLPFRYLLSSYAGAGNSLKVKRVWDLLKARIQIPYNPRLGPTNSNYLIMLQALKKLDDMEALKQCFEEWESMCVYYDIKQVNTVIGAYLSKGMVEEAELLQEKAAEKGADSDIQTYAMFADYYLKDRAFELARRCSQAATYMVKHCLDWRSSRILRK